MAGSNKNQIRFPLLWAGIYLFTLPLEAAWEKELKEVESLRNTGSYPEAKTMVDVIIENAREHEDTKALVEGLYQLALIQYFENDLDQARATLEIGRSQAVFSKLEHAEADFLSAEGVLEWKLGNLSLATPKLQAALEKKTSLKDWVTMSSISNNLGIIAYSLKDYQGAVNNYRQGIEWLGDLENNRLRASLYSNLAEVLIPMGELEEAERYLKKSLEIELRTSEPRNLGYTYYNLAELDSEKGNAISAIDYYEKALQLQLQVKDDWAAALTRLKYGQELWKLGQEDKAVAELELGFETAKAFYAQSILRDYCSTLASIHQELGNSGLVDYYGGLHIYFSERVQLKQRGGLTGSSSESETEASAASGKAVIISPLQAGTILLLCLLIATLAMEIVRLRKRMKDI
jgi:tetratricopeptide (TPR) repeat protein